MAGREFLAGHGFVRYLRQLFLTEQDHDHFNPAGRIGRPLGGLNFGRRAFRAGEGDTSRPGSGAVLLCADIKELR